MSTSAEGQWRRHMAAFSFPWASHAAPLLLLVRHLAAASPDVLFTFFGTNDTDNNIFKEGASPLPNIVPHVVDDGVLEGHVFSSHHWEPTGLFLKAAMEGSFKKGLEEAEAAAGVEISCVIADAFIWFCGDIAAEKGATWVAFWTAAAATLSTHFHTDVLRAGIGTQGLDARKDELVGAIPGFSTVRICDLPQGVLLGDLSSPFSQMQDNMGMALPKATAVVVNSYEELEQEVVEDLKIKLKSFLNVGPLTLLFPPRTNESDNYSCLPFLEGRPSASVAYIGFGTTVTPPPHELVGLAEALKASGITFIWSLNDKATINLPEGFKDRTEGRGKVAPWAPQVALLAHPAIAVFVTHGGWNSVTESIIAGVPMIGRPFYGDQMLNVRFLETVWKIGIGIEGGVFTKSGTLEALERVIGSEEGKQLRANAVALKASAEAAVQPKGSSIKNLESFIKVVTS